MYERMRMLYTAGGGQQIHGDISGTKETRRPPRGDKKGPSKDMYARAYTGRRSKRIRIFARQAARIEGGWGWLVGHVGRRLSCVVADDM